MKCLHPVEAWICGTKAAKDGVISPHVVFSPNDALSYYIKIFGSVSMANKAMLEHSISVPCGKCAACTVYKRRDMSTRLVHEASQHEKCCFITLTYNQDAVPVINGRKSLVVSDVQKFIKRLRRHLTYKPVKDSKTTRDYVKDSIRYFAVGEYGGKTHRPHYHIIVFGWSPTDKLPWSNRNGHVAYRSGQVEKLWKNGFSTVEDVSPQSCKYCARYVTKKLIKSVVGSDTDDVVPEFILQSTRNGGIGSTWFDKYGHSACLSGVCTYRQGDNIIKAPVPKYYYNRLRKRNIPVWIQCRDAKLTWIRSNISKLRDPRRIDIEFDNLRRKVDCCIDKFVKEKESEIL